MKVFITIILLFSVVVFGQQAGTATEAQPAITVQECTASSCTTIPSSVTVDANWRWLHTSSGSNCYTGNSWSASACSDPDTCAQNCVLEGVSSAEYSGTYGIKTSGSEVSLGFVTVGPYSTNVGSRVYLMENTNTYRMFQLLNKEFTVDVDASQLGCGLNGALYFVEMAADGGLSEYSGNKAGAKFGTGYCDAQCPHDVKFINGEANLVDWTPSAVDPNSGKGLYGTCCAEMDIWEANSISTAFTPHPCDVEGQTRCSGNDCGDGSNRYGGVCDKDGCDFNSYRQGNKTFYGPNMMIDSTAKVTVVTQFITSDNTDNGDLVEIRRIYKQNNVVIHNSASTFESLDGASSITDSYCQAQKSLFGDTNAFTSKGGLKQMGESLRRGMVLAMSLWVDYDANCLWLDSNYPVTSDPTTPGVARGSCATSTGVPASVISGTPNVAVKYSNIRWGPIGSTAGTGTPTTTPTTAPTTPPTATPTKKPTVAPTAPPTPAPTKPPTVAPTPTPTVRPTNPPTQAPTRPPTSAPTNPPTSAPTRPPTSAPTNPPTSAPTRPPTSAPTNPPTSAPTRPPTSAPTNAPTSAPTSAPGACADSISFTQTRSGGWTDGTNAYSQWQVTVSNSETIVSLHLSVTPEFNSYWQLNKQSDGTYSLNDWRLSSNQVLPAGSTFDFGYIKVGTEAAEFTVQSATCSATSKRAINNIEEVEEMKFDGSASSLAQISLVLVAGVCVLLL